MNQILTLHICTFFVKVKRQQHFKTFYLLHRDVSETAGRMISSLLHYCVCFVRIITARLLFVCWVRHCRSQLLRDCIISKGREQSWHDIRWWYRFLNYTLPFFVRYIIYIIPFLFTVFNNNNNNFFFLIMQESNPNFRDNDFIVEFLLQR